MFKASRDSDGELFAMKMISKQQMGQDKNSMIEKEIEILKCLKHTNIVNLVDIKQTQNNWYLIFEYCELGDLDKYIQKFFKKNAKCLVPEPTAQKIVFSIAEAFKLLNEKKIVHRDLKLANILVNKDYHIKLADFGLAKLIDDNPIMCTYVGTPVTMAPEILSHK